MARLRRVLLVVVSAVALAGCSLPWNMMFTPSTTGCHWIDVEPTALSGPAHLELRARVTAKGVDYGFPLLVERKGDSLTLVGLTPMGTKAFSVVRRGDDDEVDNKLGPGLPVPPRNVLADISAVLLPPNCSVVLSGEAVSDIGKWTLTDSCEKGKLQGRTVHKHGSSSSRDVTIDFSAGEATVKNDACRYSARYVTVKAGSGGAKK